MAGLRIFDGCAEDMCKFCKVLVPVEQDNIWYICRVYAVCSEDMCCFSKGYVLTSEDICCLCRE